MEELMATKNSGLTLKEMQSAIKDAKRRMDPVHLHWRMLESLYRTGAQRELTMLDLNRILPFPVPGAFLRTVNMVLPHLTMIINSVVQRDPKFVVTPINGDPDTVERNARIAGSILDYFWKRTEATSTLRDITQDMVILGNGFGKVGWAYSESTQNRTPEDVNSETTDLISAAHEIAQEQGQTLDENTINNIIQSVSLNQQLVEIDEPYIEYVSPYDMYLPADTRRLNTARWVAQKIRMPIEEIKNNQMFNKEARDNITMDTSFIDESTYAQYEENEQELPTVFKAATIYEFYDMKDRIITVFQENSDIPLFTGPIPYEHRFPPFIHMRNFTDGGSRVWAFGDMENIAGVQLMINEIMNSELNDLKRVGNKYFINRAALTPELSKALQDNKPDAVIPVDLGNNMSMSDIMMPVQRLATPSDNYMMEGKLQGYMQKILGISDFQAGVIDTSNRVPATAAAAVEGASTTRAIDKMTNVENAAKEIATRVLGLCQQFLDNTKALRIAGPDAITWLQVTEEDIKGEFFIEVEGGSTSAINPATRANQGQQILQQIVPMLVQMGYDPEPTMRTALGYMGLNPDNMLIKAQQQPQIPPTGQPQPQDQSASPDLSQGYTPSPEDLQGMGGPPVQNGNPNGQGY